MTDYESLNLPSQGPTPPTQPGGLPPLSQPSAWPTVIGIIAIIVGAGGALMAVWGVASLFLMDRMRTAVPTSQMAQAMPGPEWRVWTGAASVLSFGAAVFLLGAGIGILQHRRWAPRASIAWAITKMIIVVGSAAVGYMTMQGQMEAVVASTPAPMPSGFASGIAAASMCFAVVWGWALPVFVLIWFSRGKIKAEVATWT